MIASGRRCVPASASSGASATAEAATSPTRVPAISRPTRYAATTADERAGERPDRRDRVARVEEPKQPGHRPEQHDPRAEPLRVAGGEVPVGEVLGERDEPRFVGPERERLAGEGPDPDGGRDDEDPGKGEPSPPARPLDGHAHRALTSRARPPERSHAPAFAPSRQLVPRPAPASAATMPQPAMSGFDAQQLRRPASALRPDRGRGGPRGSVVARDQRVAANATAAPMTPQTTNRAWRSIARAARAPGVPAPASRW